MSIEQIKQQLNILAVLSHYGIKIGKNNMLACPFHSDDKPSMKVYPKTNTVFCFAGGCEVDNLDVIDFIMHKESCTKHQAILKAKSMLTNEPVLQATNMKKPANPNLSQDILQNFFTYCQKV